MTALGLGLALLAGGQAQHAAGPPRTISSAFRLALPGRNWHFPGDDCAHPAFANEWWYFTGNLQARTGRRFGFELTFFRISPEPSADLQHNLYFTHFAVTDPAGQHFSFWTRARRGEWLQAGAAAAGGCTLWNENWRAEFDARGPRHITAAWGRIALDLNLVSGARMFNGVDGWSQKGNEPGQASYYYSFPRMEATGSIESIPVTGLVWMDHEFASNQLAANQQGWDWMGLHLPDAELMLFNLRLKDGGRDPHSAGTYLRRGAQPIALTAADFAMTPLRRWHGYPVAWRVRAPRLHLELEVSGALDNQEIHDPAIGVTYWEGSVAVRGLRAGQPVAGEGYLELTGYGKPFGLFRPDH
ncbi:MAG: lipocalin-like domain-containing protein [Terriglobales bacterium]